MTFEYAGEHDPNLWNWIKVTSPNPTAEDVASTPLRPMGPALGTDQAYRLAISSPYFGIPIEAARHIPEMQRYMTVETLANVRKEAAADARPIVDMADRKALRDSKVADDAALAQAPHALGQLDAARALARAQMQADDIAGQIKPYRYVNVVEPTLHFLQRRQQEASDPKKLARWAGALEAQERILHATSSELREVIASIEKQRINPDAVARQLPVRDLLIAYARAGGVSHLHAEGPAALAEARRLRGQLALSQAEFQVRSARDGMLSIEDAQRTEQVPGPAEPYVDETISFTLDLNVETEQGEQAWPSAASLTLSVDDNEVRLRLVLDVDIYAAVTGAFRNNAKLAASNAPRLARFLTIIRDELHAQFVSSDGLLAVNEAGFVTSK